MMIKRLYILIMAQIVGVQLFAQPSSLQVAYKNPDLPVETRVADLLSRMTLEEKVRVNCFAPLGWRCTR